MNQKDERDHFSENKEESGNNHANQGTSDVDEAALGAGTLTDAIAGAMIGSQFGLFGTVVGGVSGGVIGNQMAEWDELDKPPASKNSEESKD